MAFDGYLLKIGTGASAVEFPMKYIVAESYKSTPNQRMEKKANRNGRGVLIRVTLPHMPYKVEFNTVENLTNTQVGEINALISSHYTVPQERKLSITYYDNENDTYKTAFVYCPDVEYNIKRIDKEHNKIIYNSLRYAFIEY